MTSIICNNFLIGELLLRTYLYNLIDIDNADKIKEFQLFWTEYCKNLEGKEVNAFNPDESYDSFHFYGQLSFHVDIVSNKIYNFTGLEEALGYEDEQWNLNEMLFSDIVHPDHMLHFFSMNRTILEFDFEKYGLRNRSFHFKLMLKHKKGKYIKFLVSSIPTLVNSDGNFAGGYYRLTPVHGMADSFNFGWDISGDEELVHEFRQAMRKHMSVLLTKRELQVLECLKEGLSSKMIAGKLGIAKNTVDNFRSSLLKKSSAGNSAQLISVAQKNGWI